MTVEELQAELDEYHGELQVVLRSDVGDTIDDYEDFSLDTRRIGDSTVLVILF